MNSTLSRRGNRLAVFVVAGFLTVFTVLSAAGCAQAPEAAQSEGEPAAIAEVPGTDLHRLTLTEHAVERVGIATAVIAVDPQTGKQLYNNRALKNSDSCAQIEPIIE